MKISTENNSKMVLVDNKLGRFAAGIGVFAGGLVMAYLCRKTLLLSVVGLAAAAAGGLIFFTTKRVHVELDRAIGKIKICLKEFKRTAQRELAFGDIQKIVLKKSIQTFRSTVRGQRSSATYYQFDLILVTKTNELLAFDFGRVKAGLMTLIVSPDNGKRAKALQIADFIGVPLEEGLPAGVTAISAIKERVFGGAIASS